eukprot:7375820-Prymnesium_polylepis.2
MIWANESPPLMNEPFMHHYVIRAIHAFRILPRQYVFMSSVLAHRTRLPASLVECLWPPAGP